MAYLLEIIGSSAIGAMVVLIILNLNSSLLSSSSDLSFDKIAQSNMTSLVEEIEYDFRKIGYRAADPVIILADTNAITFKYDTNNDGTEETIAYFLSDTTTLSMTPNPRDILLYRTVNGSGGQLKTSNVGVTRFRIWYYDATGSLTTNAANIRSIKFALNFESEYSFSDEYASTYIERLVQPNNLR